MAAIKEVYKNDLDGKKQKGREYLWLALYAFAGLGVELVYAIVLEPILYGIPMQEWTSPQIIIHWILTCITWGLIVVLLIRQSETKHDYPLTKKGKEMTFPRALVCFGFMMAAFCLDYMVWGGFKVYLEYVNHGPVLFVFQYIYYAFETMMFLLIIVFGQKACEVWFRKENFPYGGIICGLTWGLAHIFTKDLWTGVLGLLLGAALGSVYLVVNRDLKKAFIVMFLMFVL